MTKRIVSFALAAALLLTATACGGQSSTGSSLPEAEPVTFSATVLEEDESGILVEPNADTNEYKSADKISVSLKNATLTEADGTAIDIFALNMGDAVDITYDGTIAESYPAQISSCTALVRTSAADSTDDIAADNKAADPFNIPAGTMPDPDSYAEVFSQPDFTEAAGFAVSELPDLAANDISYDMDYLIDGSIAELKFTIEGNFAMFLRIAVDKGQGDISGVVGEFEEDVTDDSYGFTVRTRASAAGPAVKTWSKNGYIFSMYFPHNTMSMAGGVLQLFLDGLTLIPEQAPQA